PNGLLNRHLKPGLALGFPADDDLVFEVPLRGRFHPLAAPRHPHGTHWLDRDDQPHAHRLLGSGSRLTAGSSCPRSRLTNLLNCFRNTSSTVPTGPLRCLAMMTSMMFFRSVSRS